MTYLITPPHKILRLLVGPFLPRPLFGVVDYLTYQLLLVALWRPVRVPVPSNGGCRVPVKTQWLGIVIGC